MSLAQASKPPPAVWCIKEMRGSYAMLLGVAAVFALICLLSLSSLTWDELADRPVDALLLGVVMVALFGGMGFDLARRRRLHREERVLGYVIRFDREGIAWRGLPVIRWVDLDSVELQDRPRAKGKVPFLVLGLDEAAFAATAPRVSRDMLEEAGLACDAFRRELAFCLYGLEDRPEDILRMARRFHAHHAAGARA